MAVTTSRSSTIAMHWRRTTKSFNGGDITLFSVCGGGSDVCGGGSGGGESREEESEGEIVRE